MIEVILNMAVSADGFIADKDGGVGWLDKYNNPELEEYDALKTNYNSFYDSIDALVFGKNTYEQVLTFGPWPYPGKTSYIFGDKYTKSANKHVIIVDTDIPTFMKDVEAKGVNRLWLMGGAQLADSFDKLSLIDEYILTIIPEKLGSGIALPSQIFHANNIDLVDTIVFPASGVVQKYYKRKK